MWPHRNSQELQLLRRTAGWIHLSIAHQWQCKCCSVQFNDDHNQHNKFGDCPHHNSVRYRNHCVLRKGHTGQHRSASYCPELCIFHDAIGQLCLGYRGHPNNHFCSRNRKISCKDPNRWGCDSIKEVSCNSAEVDFQCKEYNRKISCRVPNCESSKFVLCDSLEVSYQCDKIITIPCQDPYKWGCGSTKQVSCVLWFIRENFSMQ